MFRGVLVFVLMLGLFGGQMAAVRHVHVGMSAEEQAAHDAHPHFHLGLPAKHTHHHAHGHREGDHKHASHSHHPHNGAEAEPLQCTLNAEHDDDAVFLQSVTLAHQVHSLPENSIAVVPLAFDSSALIEYSLLASSAHWHPPDKLATDSNIYLLLQNLRI